MAVYLVERYLPGIDERGVQELTHRLGAATAALRDAGVEVRWLGSLVLPGEDTCLCTFEAASARDVRTANEHANASLERIAPALAIRA